MFPGQRSDTQVCITLILAERQQVSERKHNQFTRERNHTYMDLLGYILPHTHTYINTVVYMYVCWETLVKIPHKIRVFYYVTRPQKLVLKEMHQVKIPFNTFYRPSGWSLNGLFIYYTVHIMLNQLPVTAMHKCNIDWKTVRPIGQNKSGVSRKKITVYNIIQSLT